MLKKDFKHSIRGLLSVNYPWPQWSDKEWEFFTARCFDWQLEGLLFFRLREAASTCPENIMRRLQNRFDITFAHWGRLKTEVDSVSQKFCERRIPWGLLKGYPLALREYPHSASRCMQDVDACVNYENLAEVRAIFKELGYSPLPNQSGLEIKPQFVKLHGSHVFAFEFHRTLHTSYRDKTYRLPEHSFNQAALPKSEILFLSILLHHKFFESGVRDLVDLHFVTTKNPTFDWEFIENCCAYENLADHLHRTAALAVDILESPWPNSLRKNPLKTNCSVLKIKRESLFFKKNRDLWVRFCDAIAVFFVYDFLSTGLEVFWNKYIKHVTLRKLYKIGLKNS